MYGMLHSKFKYCNPVKMQFGYSSTAIPTILTGRKPEDHGQLTFFFHDRNAGETMFSFFDNFWFRCIPRFISDRRRFRVLIARLLKSAFKIKGYFELYSVPFWKLKYFDYSEKNDLFAEKAFDNCENLKDLLLKKNISHFISDWRKSEDENFEEL